MGILFVLSMGCHPRFVAPRFHPVGGVSNVGGVCQVGDVRRVQARMPGPPRGLMSFFIVVVLEDREERAECSLLPNLDALAAPQSDEMV